MFCAILHSGCENMSNVHKTNKGKGSRRLIYQSGNMDASEVPSSLSIPDGQFDDLITTTIRYIEKQCGYQLAANTVRGHKSRIRSLYHKLGGVEFTQDWIDRARGVLKQDYKNQHVENTHITSINYLFAAHGSALRLPLYRRGLSTVPETQYHSEAECLRMIEKAKGNPCHYAVANLLYWSAAREGEIVRIQMNDINLSVSPITLRLVSTKNGKIRNIAISDPTAIKAIRDWVNLRTKIIHKFPDLAVLPWLFLSQTGTQYREDGIIYIVKRYSQLAGVRTKTGKLSSPHKWRHSRAHNLLNVLHRPVHKVAYFLGDTVDTVMRTYGHTDLDDMIDMVAL